MTNLEKYLDKIIKNIDTRGDFYCTAASYMKEDFCLERFCSTNCEDLVIKWLLENVEYVLKPSELEVLECIRELRNDPDLLLDEISLFIELRKKGWFKGIPCFSDIKLTEVLDNCQIVSEDYNDFEGCK